MDGSFLQSVLGIIVAFVVGIGYIYRAGYKYEERLSSLKEKNENLEAKIKTSETELLSLKITIKTLEVDFLSLKIAMKNAEAEFLSLKREVEVFAEEMKKKKNTPPGKYRLSVFNDPFLQFRNLL
jgi:septal ring factor EnvC (AmiA/AmiB activator)